MTTSPGDGSRAARPDLPPVRRPEPRPVPPPDPGPVRLRLVGTFAIARDAEPVARP